MHCGKDRYQGSSGGTQWAVPTKTVLFYPLGACLRTGRGLPPPLVLPQPGAERPTVWRNIHDSDGWWDHVVKDPVVRRNPKGTFILRYLSDNFVCPRICI